MELEARLNIGQYAGSTRNIAKDLTEDDLKDIGRTCIEGFKLDERKRDEHGWNDRCESATDLAMLVMEQRTHAGTTVANIKYPIITQAAIQFAARAYPNIVKGSDVVKTKVVGADPTGEKAQIAQNISEHMSWQCIDQSETWESDMDKMLHILPILGCAFKKTYRDFVNEKNKSVFIFPKDLIVDYFAESLSVAPRVSQRLYKRPNAVRELQLKDVWLPVVEEDDSTIPESAGEDEDPKIVREDTDSYRVYIEQHCWVDLDGDGYQEPYIVITHKDTEQVVYICARFDADGIKKRGNQILKITAVEYFTQYLFMESPDGSIYGMGFGTLLAPTNETVNTTINQILDAGTNANRQGGFIGRGIQLGRGRQGGNLVFKQGEWKQVNASGSDIRKSLVPIPANVQALPALFQLLGLMIESSEKLSSTTDILSGIPSGADTPATTTLALIEQGVKVYTAIYKRVYRGLKSEYRKMFRLNSLYLTEKEYYNILDTPTAIHKKDYDRKSYNVYPVADPTEVTDIQKIMKAEALWGKLGQGYNDDAIRVNWLEQMDIPDKERFLTKEPPPPPIQLQIAQMEMQIEAEKLSIQRGRLEYDMMMGRFKIDEIYSKVIKNLANAESQEMGDQLKYYAEALKAVSGQVDRKIGVINQRKAEAQQVQQKQQAQQQQTVQ